MKSPPGWPRPAFVNREGAEVMELKRPVELVPKLPENRDPWLGGLAPKRPAWGAPAGFGLNKEPDWGLLNKEPVFGAKSPPEDWPGFAPNRLEPGAAEVDWPNKPVFGAWPVDPVGCPNNPVEGP